MNECHSRSSSPASVGCLMRPFFRLGCFVAVAALLRAGQAADGVIDGNMLQLDGKRITLHGMDAFELDQPCLDEFGHQWLCGEAAKEALKDLLDDEYVHCVPLGLDRYDSIIARCTIEDGTDVGSWMVRQGWALDYERQSGGAYAEEERAAHEAGAGAWVGKFMAPWQWRQHMQARAR